MLDFCCTQACVCALSANPPVYLNAVLLESKEYACYLCACIYSVCLHACVSVYLPVRYADEINKSFAVYSLYRTA